MAANVLVTLDDLPVLGAQVYGFGHDWDVEWDMDKGPGIDGLFDQSIKLLDSERNFGDYDVKGPHYLQSPTVSTSLFIPTNATPAEALALLEDLNEAWAPLPSTDPASLTIEMYGETYPLIGAPIGTKVDLTRLAVGDVRALCHFKVYGIAVGS